SVNGRFLIQDRAVVTLIRSGDLTRLAGQTPGFDGTWTFYANPDGSLPGAEAESRAVTSRRPGAQLFVGAQASESQLVKLAGSSRLLHLATHGSVNRRNPDLSYLLMAGQDKLTRRDVLSTLSLPATRLVTLSACESALSGQSSGTEVNSLADAFWTVGARAVIGSLWRVPDRSTSLLMQDLYNQVSSGRNLAEALRHAQLSLLANPATAHPQNWAGFLVWGDWR
ncbi:MAG: CHAT domain-containing protein, partial [Candidatus Eremiobacteraeota bacterium]|nr:CHAT domain-containing protein [Candidatus Eremiobacteraeota bacterium]